MRICFSRIHLFVLPFFLFGVDYSNGQPCAPPTYISPCPCYDCALDTGDWCADPWECGPTSSCTSMYLIVDCSPFSPDAPSNLVCCSSGCSGVCYEPDYRACGYVYGCAINEQNKCVPDAGDPIVDMTSGFFGNQEPCCYCCQ